MPSLAVLFVTRTGHARELAQELGRVSGGAVHEIVDLRPRRGLIGWLRAGHDATRRLATPIADPGVDLGQVEVVAIVQPVWASSVCPPLRSWIRAHRGELAGKRLGLLSSNKGSPGAAVQAAFESEFGQLAACEVIAERLGPEERGRRIEAFYRRLTA